jgi:hypothetical protein
VNKLKAGVCPEGYKIVPLPVVPSKWTPEAYRRQQRKLRRNESRAEATGSFRPTKKQIVTAENLARFRVAEPGKRYPPSDKPGANGVNLVAVVAARMARTTPQHFIFEYRPRHRNAPERWESHEVMSAGLWALATGLFHRGLPDTRSRADAWLSQRIKWETLKLLRAEEENHYRKDRCGYCGGLGINALRLQCAACKGKGLRYVRNTSELYLRPSRDPYTGELLDPISGDALSEGGAMPANPREDPELRTEIVMKRKTRTITKQQDVTVDDWWYESALRHGAVITDPNQVRTCISRFGWVRMEAVDSAPKTYADAAD